MKVYSIGREQGCDIVINDPTDVISRRHATLVVTSTGKMTITDLSHNGTYVNGIRIAQNVPVPVTRKDSVSFAQIARLDWNLVPKSNIVVKYAAIAAGAIIVVVACVLLFNYCGNSKGGGQDQQQTDTVATDTIKKVEPKTEEEIRKEIKDSMAKEAKAKADSTADAKRKQDSIADARKKAQAAAQAEKKKKDNSKETKKKDETKKDNEAKKDTIASRLR